MQVNACIVNLLFKYDILNKFAYYILHKLNISPKYIVTL